MRIVGFSICFIAVMTIGVIVFYPMVRWVTDEGPVESILYMIPFLLILAVPLVFIGFYVVGSGNDVSIGYDEDDAYAVTEKYDYARTRLGAEEILRGRYAQGKISDEEFTKRMARL